jgi:ankyrin repeat protein
VGADLNATKVDGETPLFVATRWNEKEVGEARTGSGGQHCEERRTGPALRRRQQWLDRVCGDALSLPRGCAADGNGWTPCWAAAGAGHVQVVRDLWALGENVGQQDKFGGTPVEGGHVEVVKTLWAQA